MHDKSDVYMQHEIAALNTSNRWATLGIVIVVLLALAGLGWAVEHYFGGQGVRVFLVAAGVAVIVLLVYALSVATAAVYGRMAMQHHDAVLNGLIQFQKADDYGEVARTVAAGMGGALRSGASLDARVLGVANQIAQQQQRMLTDSQRQQAGAPTWAAGVEEEPATVNGFGFRRVE